jgi:hypothetical protein
MLRVVGLVECDQKNSAPRSRPTDAKAAETRKPALQIVASIFIVSVSKFVAVMEKLEKACTRAVIFDPKNYADEMGNSFKKQLSPT